MGQRANLIIVENKKYEIYYDHWCANTLDNYQFWGVEAAVTFFRNHEKSGQDWWLDTVWCEGGAVIDLDEKTLLFFGGEDILYDLPLRQVYLDLLTMNWPGYDIRWAWRGIVDLADYVGYDRKKLIVASDREFPPIHSPDVLCIHPEGEGIISVDNGEEVLIYPSGCFTVDEILCYGENLVEALGQEQALRSLLISSGESVLWGVHINKNEKQLCYWFSGYLSEHFDEFDNNWTDWTDWSGWQVTWLKDQYQKHFEIIKNKFKYFLASKEEFVREIKNNVCRDFENPHGIVKSLITTLQNNGHSVEVSNTVFFTESFERMAENPERFFDALACQYLAEI